MDIERSIVLFSSHRLNNFLTAIYLSPDWTRAVMGLMAHIIGNVTTHGS